MAGMMRAIVLDAPGPPEALVIRDRPIPTPTAWLGADQGQGLRVEPF